MKTICMIGGDERNNKLGELLKKDYIVKKYINQENALRELLKNSDCVVSGIPFSRDNETINMPSSLEKLSIETIFTNMKDVKKIIAGSFSDKVRELAYVVKIDAIEPIEGRDRVEAAVVGGWRTMVRKGLFKPGDLGIYIEILPS